MTTTETGSNTYYPQNVPKDKQFALGELSVFTRPCVQYGESIRFSLSLSLSFLSVCVCVCVRACGCLSFCLSSDSFPILDLCCERTDQAQILSGEVENSHILILRKIHNSSFRDKNASEK